MSLRLKLRFGDEIRRVSISEEDLHNLTLSTLKTKVEDLFHIQPDSFNIQFIDSQNKPVYLNTDADLEVALLSIHMASPSTPLTMNVLPKRSLTDTEIISEFSHILSDSTQSMPSAPAPSAASSTAPISPPLASESCKTEKRFEEELFEVLMSKANDLQQLLGDALEDVQMKFEEVQMKVEKMVFDKKEPLEKPAETKNAEQKLVAHPAYCNECTKDIFGTRYKCTVCYDYDLCEACDAKREHDPTHTFLRLLVPQHVEESARTALAPISQYDAKFISDVTVPDGSQVEPGKEFLKIWEVKNTCQYTWPEGTSLHFIGGTRMNDTEFAVLQETVEPGATVSIAMRCTAPSEPGEYTSFWQIYHPIAEKGFGDRLWVRVEVTDLKLETALGLLEGMGFNREAVTGMMKDSGFDINQILEMVGLGSN